MFTNLEKKIVLSIYLFSCLFFLGSDGYAASKQLLNMTFSQTPFQEVINEVSTQTGLTITIEPSDFQIAITGTYSQISIDDFFLRTLKNENYTTTTSLGGKTVTIHIFNKARLYAANTNNTVKSPKGLTVHQDSIINDAVSMLHDEHPIDYSTATESTENSNVISSKDGHPIEPKSSTNDSHNIKASQDGHPIE